MAKLKTELPAARARNSVRIVGGSWRGRRVRFPDLPGLRPTPDRVRETLFNWLQHSIVDTRCLDLYAGSGALGLEALSRGAREVVFVEKAESAARNLAEQLKILSAVGRARIEAVPAAQYLKRGGEAFDILFLDPPFDADLLPSTIEALRAGGWVRPGSLLYLEEPSAKGAPALPERWELLKSKSAGEVGYHLARVN